MIKPKIKMSKLKLDLSDIFNNSKAIEASLEEVINEAIEKKIKTIEINYWKLI